MFTIPPLRKCFYMFAVTMLALPTIARADDRSERDRLLAAIDAVRVKIDLTHDSIEKLEAEISDIKASIEEYRKLYKETKKPEYKKAITTAEAKLEVKLSQLDDDELDLEYYEETLARLQKKLALLDG